MSLPIALALALAFQQAASFQLKLPATLLPSPPAADKVLVTVGGVPIRALDVQPFLWDWAAQGAVQELVSYQIVAGEAAKAKVTVTDADVEKAVQAQLDQYRKQLPPGTDLQTALRDKGFAKSRLHVVIKTDLLLEKLVSRNLKPETFVKVATIVVKPSSESVADLGAAIQVSQAAYDRLIKGEAWATVLKEVVKDEAAKKNDGFLGWRSFEAFPKATQDILKALPIGGVSAPVQTAYGLQIFRVLGHGQEAKGDDLVQLKAQYMGIARPKLLEKMRQDVKIVWSKG